MNEETLNTSVRKFLKKFGITAQREIEKAVREGIESGRLKGDEDFTVHARLESDLLKEPFLVDGDIKLV